MKLRGTTQTKSVIHLVLLLWCLSNIQHVVAKWMDKHSAGTNSASDSTDAKVAKSEEDPFRMMEDDLNKDGFSFDKFMSEMHDDAFTKHGDDNGTNSDNDMKLDISKEMEETFPGHNANVETTTAESITNQETTLCTTNSSAETSTTTLSTIVRRTTTSKVKYQTTVAATVSNNADHAAPPKRKSKSARQTTTVRTTTTFPTAIHPTKATKRHGKTLDNNGGQSAKNLNNQAPGIKNDHQLNGASMASGAGYTVHSSEYNDYRDDQSYKKKSKVHENGTHHEPNKHSTFSKSHKHEHSENKHTQVTSSRDHYSTSTGDKPSLPPESKPSSQQTHSKKGSKKGQSHSGKGGRKPTTAKPTKKAKVKSGGSKSKSVGAKAVASGAKASTRKASASNDTPVWKKNSSKSAPSSKHRSS